MYLILCLFSFVVSLFTVQFIKQAFSQQLLDIPNERSSHTQPTPRSGGLGFIIAFGLTSAIAYFFNYRVELHGNWWLMLIPLIIIGIIDDRQGVKALIRYAFQLGVAVYAVFIYGGFPLPGEGMVLAFISVVLTVIAFTALINFYNFIDGLDGLAAGCSVIQLSFFAFYLKESFLLFLVAACLGFLYWNWSPAKIFMGDAGSTFLGAIVGFTLLSHFSEGLVGWSAIGVILPLVGDTTYTIVCRLLEGENIFQAHRRHVYQRLQKSGWSHGQVSLTYIVLTLLIAVVTWFNSIVGLMFAIASVVVGIISAEFYLTGSTNKVESKGL